MSNLLAVKPEFANAKILLPSGKVVEPRIWNGDVVAHKPLSPLFSNMFEFGDIIGRNRAIEVANRALEEHAGRKLKWSEKIPPIIAGAAASAWVFTNGGRTNLLDGTFDINSDTWKMALFLSTSDLGATETTYAGVTNEHANANGYTTGGNSITLTLAGTTTVTVDISSDPVWTASGGSITARFAAIYEVSGNILVYCTLDSTPADVTATSGNTLTVAANASGVFTLA